MALNFELTPSTSEESKAIRAIGKDTVHKICAGQVNFCFVNIYCILLLFKFL